jgi:hypothetical protein
MTKLFATVIAALMLAVAAPALAGEADSSVIAAAEAIENGYVLRSGPAVEAARAAAREKARAARLGEMPAKAAEAEADARLERARAAGKVR